MMTPFLVPDRVARGSWRPVMPETAPPIIAPASVHLRASALLAVGPTVDALYPNGFQKLAARYDDARHGYAKGHLLLAQQGAIAGYAMESPKGSRVVKLSTFWIHPSARGRGLGRALASSIVAGWLDRDVQRGYVTVRCGIDAELLRTLAPLGFEMVAVVPSLYGEDQDEAILEWQVCRVPDRAWLDFHASLLRQPSQLIS